MTVKEIRMRETERKMPKEEILEIKALCQTMYNTINKGFTEMWKSRATRVRERERERMECQSQIKSSSLNLYWRSEIRRHKIFSNFLVKEEMLESIGRL